MAKKEQDTNALQLMKGAIRAKQPENLYFFHGEEGFLLNHYLEQLRKLLLDDLTESFNYHRLNAETFDIRDFADAVENLPMMAEHTMVQVDDIDLFKLPEDTRNKVAEILTDIPDYCNGAIQARQTAEKAVGCHRQQCFHRRICKAGAAGSNPVDHPAFCGKGKTNFHRPVQLFD